jgi:threonine synthase
MRYYSTRSKTKDGFKDGVRFAEATLSGLAPDGGLFVPEAIPPYPATVKSSLSKMSFLEIAFETIKPYVAGEIPDSVLEGLVAEAFSFGAPLVAVGDRLVLELFHGPTAAFKDFGARFMARTFAYLRRGEDRPLHILVATSGDTGGAVADGFFGVDGISVTVLYPRGRVSPLQERQIAGLGGNITAFAVDGSFDDCQRLVKAAFADETLRKRLVLSSANSINIARLLPQAVYYAAAAADAERRAAVKDTDWSWSAGFPLSFCVPSGNFGNLTAGLYAYQMGAPINHFVAATNINKTLPDYLENGVYTPRPSQATLSNAMDVGAPSNFERMQALWPLKKLQSLIKGVFVSDEDTRKTITAVHKQYGYVLDPHTAVGWAGLNALNIPHLMRLQPYALLSTAHPAKFAETVEPLTGALALPPSLQQVMARTPLSSPLPNEIAALVDATLPS